MTTSHTASADMPEHNARKTAAAETRQQRKCNTVHGKRKGNKDTVSAVTQLNMA